MKINMWVLLSVSSFVVISYTACAENPANENAQKEEPKKISATVELNNTYQTRYGKIDMVSWPQFQYDYSDNWKILKEEISSVAFDQRVIIANDRGTTVTYMQTKTYGFSAKGRTMLKVEVSKAADSSFIPAIPEGTDLGYSDLGNFMVAKLKIVGELYMDEDSDFTAIDGGILYAVLPESYVGTHEVVGLFGLYEECSFEYPGLYAFIAEAPSGEFTDDEEKEVIAILASFRNE